MSWSEHFVNQTITAIKEALAQPETWEKFCDSNCVWTDHHSDCKMAEQEHLPNEPVGHIAGGVHPSKQERVGYWMGEFNDGSGTLYEVPQESLFGRKYRNIPLYTTPPQRKPLTERELADLHSKCAKYHEEGPRISCWYEFARAIEAAHGIKGEA